ncbi:MAG: hypothetical protein DSY38_05075, partial [Fusobacteria bacterium]
NKFLESFEQALGEMKKSKTKDRNILNDALFLMTPRSRGITKDSEGGANTRVSGEIEKGQFLEVGYFKQEESESSKTALDEFWDEFPSYTNGEVRSALARCGLTKDHIGTRMRALSGGENAKVRLAKIMNREINFLVLDEPTNHLDIDAKNELKRALIEFKGTIFMVSHEPDFYMDIVTEVWNVEDWTTKII